MEKQHWPIDPMRRTVHALGYRDFTTVKAREVDDNVLPAAVRMWAIDCPTKTPGQSPKQ